MHLKYEKLCEKYTLQTNYENPAIKPLEFANKFGSFGNLQYLCRKFA